MPTLQEARSRHAEALSRALDTAVDCLGRLPEVEKVILFGSYGRGRRDLFTDLDLLVILETKEGFLTRLRHLYGLLAGKLGVDYDLVAYTPEEIEENRSRPFLKRALAEGKVVYERSR